MAVPSVVVLSLSKNDDLVNGTTGRSPFDKLRGARSAPRVFSGVSPSTGSG